MLDMGASFLPSLSVSTIRVDRPRVFLLKILMSCSLGRGGWVVVDTTLTETITSEKMKIPGFRIFLSVGLRKRKRKKSVGSFTDFLNLFSQLWPVVVACAYPA